jgi:COP9 signalosome complex subunit 2
LVLANMMMESSVDPFDSQEARPYKTDPVVAAMTSLVAAYQSSDILAFEEAVKHKDIAGDAFVAPYIDDLRKKVCSKVILKGIGCFTRVKLDHVKEMVGSSEIDVDELLLSLILDKKIEGGRINQYDKVLEIERQSKKEEMYRALAVWSQAVSVNAQGIGEGLR